MKVIINGQVAESGGSSSSGDSSIPSGGIIMWAGTEVPDGWALCDGENGTPDLRGRFVLGTSEGHALGETGGEEEVVLTVEQMPKHTHEFTIFQAGSFESNQAIRTVNNEIGTRLSRSTTYSGENQPHENMPPYYVLAYIMKL